MHRREEFAIVGYADMLEHADRYDAIENFVDFAIVLQIEAGAIVESFGLGALVSDFMLLLRERDSGDLGAMLSGEVKPKPAPSAADIEDTVAGFQKKLGGDERLLVSLCGFQAVIRMPEISAGILTVGVQEQVVKRARQVIVMRYVTSRPLDRIELRQPATEPPETRQPAIVPYVGLMSQIDHEQFNETVDVVILDGKCPIHIGFAQREIGIEDKFPKQGPRMKPDGDR